MGYRAEGKQRYRDIVVGATCDNCGKDLEPVYLIEDNRWIGKMADGALEIRLTGGYGQYFDALYAGCAEVLFCTECADRLMELFPCMKTAIDVAEEIDCA